MSETISAFLSAAMTVAFFYGMFNAGLFLAMVLLVLLLRYAPQSMYTDAKKDTDDNSADAQETN
jgi:hypothetical protein